MPYSFHRFLIDFKTPPLSPLHADTMFGHLCWALKAVNGEEALLSFLQQMQGSDPLIILSDLLPRGYLPKRINLECSKTLPDKLKKQIKKLRYTKRADAFDDAKLAAAMASTPNYAPEGLQFDVTRTSIDRYTGKALDGGLFSCSTVVNRAGYDLYAAFASEDIKELFLRLLYFIQSSSGYGADKSSGFGQLGKIVPDEIEPEISTRLRVSSQKHCLALSGFVPINVRLSDCSYKLRVKYGRLAGDFAAPQPFKRPLAFLDAGSVYLSEDNSMPVGSMVADVAPQLSKKGVNVLQYGYALGLEL